MKAYINAGKLTAGHARALIGQPNAEAARASRSSTQGLNVRQVEAMAQESAAKRQGATMRKTGARGKDADTSRWRSGCPMRSASR